MMHERQKATIACTLNMKYYNCALYIQNKTCCFESKLIFVKRRENVFVWNGVASCQNPLHCLWLHHSFPNAVKVCMYSSGSLYTHTVLRNSGSYFNYIIFGMFRMISMEMLQIIYRNIKNFQLPLSTKDKFSRLFYSIVRAIHWFSRRLSLLASLREYFRVFKRLASLHLIVFLMCRNSWATLLSSWEGLAWKFCTF